MIQFFVAFFERKIYPGLKIKKNELVIDIGSGDKPFWRANVFFDDLALGDNQRVSGKNTIHQLGTFINGNILQSPFKDKVFDFSFSSHLLEHVENPDVAIKEITRISKRGYIEVPNAMLEYITPFHSHLWYIVEDNKKLYFLRKSKQSHSASLKNSKYYGSLTKKITNPFIRFYWKNTINYEIINDLKKGEEFTVQNDKVNKTKKKLDVYFLMILVLRWIFRVDNHEVSLKTLLKRSK